MSKFDFAKIIVVTLALFAPVSKLLSQSVEVNGRYYTTIKDAIASAPIGAVVRVGYGTFNEDVLINKSIRLKGVGRGQTIIKGVKDALNTQKSTVLITADAVTLEGCTITRNGNNVSEWNDGLNTSGITVSGVTEGAIFDNEIIGNQVGIELFNTVGDSIIQNVIDTNRIGILLHGSFTNTRGSTSYVSVVQDNQISYNWTAGIKWIDQVDGDLSMITFYRNKIWDNWYSGIESRTDVAGQKNFSPNYLGFDLPTAAVSPTAVEPSYQNQIPFMYGGSATPPTTGAVTIRASSQLALDNIVYTPYYTDMGLTALTDVLSNPVLDTLAIGSTVITSEIPAGVIVTASDYWDGVINPPTESTNTGGRAPAGFQIGSTVIEVGSPYTSLYFSSPASLTLNGVAGPVGYSAPNSNIWTTITETCGGSYDSPSNPSSPTGECYISNGTDTKIITYHFTRFASLIDERPLVISAASITIPATLPGCKASLRLNNPTVTRNTSNTAVTFTNNAPAIFPAGITIVTWTAKDEEDHSSEFKQTVTVTTDLRAASPSSYALPNGTDANTVYIGYTPASKIQISASVNGGIPPYSFSWNTNSNQSAITVQPTSQTIYSFSVHDAIGCSQTFNKTVYVKDVRCGQKLDRVAVCETSDKKEKNNCAPEIRVAKILANGGYLGVCDNRPTSRLWSETMAAVAVAPEESYLVGVKEFEVKAFPNPSSAAFNVKINSDKNEKVSLRVADVLGRLIEVRNNIKPGAIVQLGNSYKTGYYFIEVIQGSKSKQIKLIKR